MRAIRDRFEVRTIPEGVFCSGTEADASGRIWFGDPTTGILRAARIR